MKGITVFSALIVLCILVFLPGNGLSEIREGSVSLNPNVGGYDFQRGQHIDDDLTYGLGLGYNFTENWGVEGNFNYVDTESNADATEGEKVKAYLYRLDALYHFMPEKKLVPYLSAGVGAIRIDGDIDNEGSDTLLNFGGGIKYFFTDNLAVRGDIRQIITDDPNYNLIYTIGLNFLFGGEKKAAPEPAPEPAPAPEPVAPKPSDSDGDGVYDDMDKCPDTPKGVAVDSNGCPLDSDGDGVYDYLDKCPDTPKGVAVDSNGCPLDSDGDGVYDYLDKCPDTPKGVAVDSTGCPIPAKVEKVIVLEDIHFDFDKATLTDEAKGILKKNIQTLTEDPSVDVRIEGHTCAHGEEDYNLRLSERRANAVKEYLVKEGGISAERLTTISYGETRLAMPETPTPANKNSTEAKANRRVHFVVITK